MNIAGYEHHVVSMADYLKVKADAERMALVMPALIGLASGMCLSHASSIGLTQIPDGLQNIIDQSRAALAAHERGEG